MNVLRQLLAILSRGETCTLVGLARELEVTPELVEQMLADLVRAGYLRTVDVCAAGKCQGCGHSSSCGSSPTRIWVLTRDS